MAVGVCLFPVLVVTNAQPKPVHSNITMVSTDRNLFSRSPVTDRGSAWCDRRVRGLANQLVQRWVH